MPKQDTIEMRDYIAGPTAEKFHACGDFVRGVLGPVGSGKTVICCVEVFSRSLEQRPDKNGVRRTRWAFIRNTFPELLSTTIKTWQDWVSPEICPITQGAVVGGTLKVELPDDTRVEAEMIFLSLDRDEDIRKLKSLELTGGFINEASEIRESVFQMLKSRVDRYPSKDMGGATWTGIIMDTNPPSDHHWWYRLAEVEKPEGHRFWRQPPAVVRVEPKEKGDPPTYLPNDGTHGFDHAENIENHNSGFEYYMRQIPGSAEDWIRVFLMGEYGTLMTGRPVYPEYSDVLHLAPENLLPFRGLPLLLAWDFGLTPACVILQQTPNGQVRVLDELYTEESGIDRFSRDIVKPHLDIEYREIPYLSVGDPAGSQRGQADETTCFQILELNGIPTAPAPTNSFQIRREAVAFFLTKLADGKPGFLLSPKCDMIRRGFLTEYRYRKLRTAASESSRFAESPEKNMYSHPHDALQYGCSYYRSASIQAAHRGGLHSALGGGRREVIPADTGGWA